MSLFDRTGNWEPRPKRLKRLIPYLIPPRLPRALKSLSGFSDWGRREGDSGSGASGASRAEQEKSR